MPGMMRTRSTGCTCCGDWGPDRASDNRAWRHLEQSQTDPWRALDGEARPPRQYPLDPDDLQDGGYWASVRADDGPLNDLARQYLSSAVGGAADG